MQLPLKKYHVISLVLVLGLVTACGYAEWPPRESAPRDINAAGSQRTTRSAAANTGGAIIVGKGDTVYGLSRRHQVPMRAFIEANNLQAPFVLYIGQQLQLPRVNAHKIVRGDTLFGIANTYDVNAFELARINGLNEPYVIHVGDSLVMPADTPAITETPTRVIAKNAPAQAPVAQAPVAQAPAAPAPASPAQASSDREKPPTPAWVAPPKLKTASTSKAFAPRQRQTLNKPPATSRKGFLWPVRGKIISTYGAKSKGLHNDGINIQAKRGHSVRAAENGIVAYAGNELRGFGNLLLIKHADGWVTAYAHNEQLLVKRGDKIKRGQKIATIGSTGNVSSPQLHFEIRRGNKARDPSKLLRGAA